jgi:predicted amidohydrolase
MQQSDHIRIGVVQMCSSRDRRDNLRRAEHLMDRARANGAQLVALPENFSFLGADGEKPSMAEGDEGPSVNFLRNWAQVNGTWVVGGSVAWQAEDPDSVFNTCLVFDPGGRSVVRYDKMHLFDVNVDESNNYRESDHVRPGSQISTFAGLGHHFGLSICYDLRFPELYRRMVRRGVEAILVPAAFTRETGRDHWEPLIRARAIENLCYVIAPAQHGHHFGSRYSYGRSMVVGPWGQILAQAEDGEGVIVCDLNFELLREARRRLPALDHIRDDLMGPVGD